MRSTIKRHEPARAGPPRFILLAVTFTRPLASAFALTLALAAPAAAKPTFRNVLPAGQGETVNAAELAQSQASGQPPATFTSQNPLYTGLVGAAPALKPRDLKKYFKPEGFGIAPGDVVSESTPRPGVRIARDGFNVPHVFGDTRADTMFGAGYATAEDRLFFMDVLRHTGRARLTELIGPGEDDANVRMDAEQLKVADYDEGELQQMIDRARQVAGPEGATIQGDLDAYVAGVNQYISEARSDPSQAARRVPRAGQAARGLEADGHRRDRLADRRHLRQGRRRGGQGRAGARRRAGALRRQARPQGLQRLPLLRRSRGARHHEQALPLRRSRQAEPGRGREPGHRLDPGSRPRRPGLLAAADPAPAAARGPRPPGPQRPAVPARAVQRPAGRRQGVQVRAPDRRHGPAGRLLLARDPDGDRHARRRDRRARRDLPRHQPLRADRARQGLRVEHHHRVLRQRRRVRRAPLRAGRRRAHARLGPLPLQGAVHPVRAARPDADGHPGADRSRHHAAAPDPHAVAAQRARPGAGDRDGQGRPGGDQRGALDLQARDRLRRRLQAAELRRGHQPEDVPARVRARELRLQPLLHRRPPHRLHHRRLVPASRQGRRSQPARVGHRRVGLAGLRPGDLRLQAPRLQAAARSRSIPRRATSRTGTTSRRAAGAPPTTTSRSAPSSACSGSPSACARASRAAARCR